MGIQGLWQVLEPTGRPVTIQSLGGKVLAVDVSIWLHQLVKGFRDKDGNPLPNAHLLGVFHRVCKLLHYGIKPVFVFDGGVPILKRQTLAARRTRKLESLDKAELARQRIITTYLQQQLQRSSKQALPPTLRMEMERLRKTSPSKKSQEKEEVDEDLAKFRQALVEKLEDDIDQVETKEEKESDEEGGYRYGVDYSENFGVIQAPDFDTLPLETQHEILFEMQESRKMNSWGKFDKMPKDLQSFSSFQMDRLVKRRTLQKKIQSVQKEMGQRHIHVQNLDDLLKMDYSGEKTEVLGGKDDGFVLIKSKEEPKPGTSKGGKEKVEVITIDDFVEDSDDDGLDADKQVKGEKVKNVRDEEEDLERAIKLSLAEAEKEKEREEKVEEKEKDEGGVGQNETGIEKNEMSCEKILDVGFPNEKESVAEISESDDDFEEVEESNSSNEKTDSGALAITIDLSRKVEGDDIFADIFAETEKKSLEEEGRDGNEEKGDGDGEVIDIDRPKEDEMETKWDSDGEIEAELMDMVMRESVMEGVEVEKGDNGNKLEVESEKVEEKKSERTGVKLITAEYMQAQEKLNAELAQLKDKRGFEERVATSISDQMQLETQELISLFGIPYVVSPTEAESQCAFLDKMCLTEGSVTDDSDVWLFGGQRVYKNFFSQGQRHLEFYQASDIERILNLNREKLIALAMMIGSDYSEGIQGVGPILALEILSEFSSNEGGYESLEKFKEWWEGMQGKGADVGAGSRLKEKMRKLKLRPGFPNKAVYEAFINPAIDASTESFKWGTPDLDAIRTYTKQKFGWEQAKCDSFMLPVLKRIQEGKEKQKTLDGYIQFGRMPRLESGKRKRSKRMESAVKKLKRGGESELRLSEDEEEEESPVDERKAGGSGKKVASQDDRVERPSPSKKAIAAPRIPKAQVIPQRIQAESDKLKNKEKAIRLFKKK